MAVAETQTAASGTKPPLIQRDMIVKWAPLLVLLVLVAFFAIMEPRFFSIRNFARIGISSAPALMVAIGVTFIILMGSIDLSMEGTVSVSAVLFAFCLSCLGWDARLLGVAGDPDGPDRGRGYRVHQRTDTCAT